MTTGTLKVDTTHLTTHLTTPASYAASVLAFLGSLTLSDLGILVSILLGIATFFINWYYKHVERADRRRALKQQEQD